MSELLRGEDFRAGHEGVEYIVITERGPPRGVIDPTLLDEEAQGIEVLVDGVPYIASTSGPAKLVPVEIPYDKAVGYSP